MSVSQLTSPHQPVLLPTLQTSRPLRYVTFFYLYVMQGIPAGFALTAVANYLTAEGVKPNAVGTFVAAVGLPWTAQFVWGPLIDRFQGSIMGRRRPWVLLAQLMAFAASLGILLVDNPVTQLSMLAAAFFTHSVFATVQDASVDAMAISIIPASERGRVNAFMRGGFLVGIGLSAAAFSYLIRSYSFHTAALTQSLILLVLTAVTFFVKEKPEDAWFPWSSAPAAAVERKQHDHSIGWLFRELYRGLVARESLQLFIPILVVYTSLSIFIRAYPVHLIQELHWRDTDLSFMTGTYGTAVMVLFIFVGGWVADRIGSRRLLVYVMLGCGLFLVTANALSPYWIYPRVASSIYVLYYVLDPLVSVAAMPALMALCRRDVEGSQFTTYMALVNLCDVAGSFISGHVQMVVKAPLIGLLCGVAILSALAVTLWVDRQQRLIGSKPMQRFDL
ncbi:MAG: MFS transporter [Bacteroidetes bacterium]|nr:MFS transporter [Fibrella sp.]